VTFHAQETAHPHTTALSGTANIPPGVLFPRAELTDLDVDHVDLGEDNIVEVCGVGSDVPERIIVDGVRAVTPRRGLGASHWIVAREQRIA